MPGSAPPPPPSLPATGADGLTAAEAARRLALYGPNAGDTATGSSHLRLLREIVTEPMFLLLALAASLYLLFGDLVEGLLLGGFALLTVILVVQQQLRSDRALAALRELGAPLARVRRDGREQRLAASAVVPGDLLLIEEGERVAADGCLRAASGLVIDESLLTGESVPVRKRALQAADCAGASAAPGGDDQPVAFAGTLVVAGHGVVEVRATGAATAAGGIGAALAGIRLEPTLLQRNVARLARLFGLLALGFCALIVLLHGGLRGDWLEAALAGIALAMALLPEEFPVALAVFLALGAWRLARLKVLVRWPAVIETLGATSVLCVDKTGTLTENRMRLHTLVAADGQALTVSPDLDTLPEHFHVLLESAVLASRAVGSDPMDLATRQLGGRALAATAHLHADWPLVREYGLRSDLPALTQIWQSAPGHWLAAAKGAPEAIATLCRFKPSARAALLAAAATLARQGLRVLAVAAAPVPGPVLPADPRALALVWQGLVGFVDPLRPQVPQAVADARAAGVAVVMITGDFPATALAIAASAGIDTAAGALSGSELDSLDDAALAAAVCRTRVYARIRPEQKLRLVQAFKAGGAVVAMTGDGVNDAPALKAAHIGLAMGSRSTAVAREAAGIVLLDDDFADLVQGVRQGRLIFDNLRKLLMFIAAVHLPIAGLALLPLVFGWPPLLLPLHMVLIELVIDPICALAFERTPPEPGLMQRPPRDPQAPLIGGPQLLLAAAAGALLLLATAMLYVGALRSGWALEQVRTLVLLALTAGNLTLVRVLSCHGWTLQRLRDPGQAGYWLVASVAALVVVLILSVPALATLFRLAPLPTPMLLLALGIGIGSVLLFDLVKPWSRVQQVLKAPGVHRDMPALRP